MGSNPSLINNFSWSGLNKKVQQVDRNEAMRFGRPLHRLFGCILETKPMLGKYLLGKVDLANA